MTELITNGLQVTLSNGGVSINSTATTITVSLVVGSIPSFTSGSMRCLWDGELIQVTTTTGTGNTTWTIVRGIEGTTAISHADASYLYQVGTSAGTLAYIQNQITAMMKPPYFYDGANYFTASGYVATRPSSSPTFLSTTATVAAGTNGDIVVTSGSGQAFASQTAASSVEAELSFLSTAVDNSANFSGCGVWLWDSTNAFVYLWSPFLYSGLGAGKGSSAVWNLQKWTYAGSGNPTFSSTIFTSDLGYFGSAGLCHLKLVVSAGTLSAQVSLNGGVSLSTITTCLLYTSDAADE